MYTNTKLFSLLVKYFTLKKKNNISPIDTKQEIAIINEIIKETRKGEKCMKNKIDYISMRN